MDNLEEPIQVSCQAAQPTLNDHLDVARQSNSDGNKLQTRYQRTERMVEVEEATKVTRQANHTTPDDHPDFARRLHKLGIDLISRYDRTNQMEDLEEAIQVSRRAVQTTPNNHSDLAGRLSNLGVSLVRRYLRMGQLKDIEEAIQVSRQAIQVTPNCHPHLTGWLSNLGIFLESRFKQTGQLEDLEEAIRVSYQAVQTTPDNYPNLAGLLVNLGSNLEFLFKRTGQIKDLKKAIRVFRQAVRITPNDHPDLTWRLHHLGIDLVTRYDRTRQIEDLEEAIQVSRRAVQITPDNHSDLTERLSILGALLLRRYQRIRQLNNLEEAIQVSRQAIQATPNNHPNLAGRLSNLGVSLESRFKRTGQIEDLEEAIRVCRQAIQATPNDHSERAGRLSNLGLFLQSRFKQTGQLEDLEEAIRVSRQVLQTIPYDDPDYTALSLNNLGTKLKTRYDRIGQMEDLEEAIRVSRQAIQAAPNYHTDLAGWLTNLGIYLESRFRQTGQLEDLKESVRLSLQALRTTSAPPLHRITPIHLAIRLLIEQEDYQGAYEVSVEAIDLLQLVHERALTLQDRQHVVSLFSTLATRACSLALQTKQPLFEALRLLEGGRGVILSLLMDDRSDTSKLKEAHPALCTQYESLRLEVNTPLKSTTSQRTGEFISTRRPNAIEELEKCIQDIRHLPDLGSFQQGLTTEQIQNASKEGSIIVVNVTGLRSDAIIISTSGFSLIPLPRFFAVQAQSWVDQKLTSASRTERGVKNKSYRRFLTWLWSECVKTVLAKLGHSVQSSLEDLPRVWWIGTGLASSFPFHAACDISTGENTFYRVLSSYTPSIKALIHARERVSISTPSNENPSKLLMVTMAKTPGANDLPGVKAEKSTVLGALGNFVQVEFLDQPDSASVMRQIRKCNIAHFACHGTSHSDDPSKSGLLLQTATANPRQDILSVLKLCENHPTLGEIAYLSACSTAENQAEDLIDEVLHVVSGFQVAGFRHVIGTLWPSYDSVCVEVARSFYTELCQNGALEYTDRAVAMALHKAVVSTSVDYQKRPLHWAQYVHYGA